MRPGTSVIPILNNLRSIPRHYFGISLSQSLHLSYKQASIKQGTRMKPSIFKRLCTIRRPASSLPKEYLYRPLHQKVHLTIFKYAQPSVHDARDNCVLWRSDWTAVTALYAVGRIECCGWPTTRCSVSLLKSIQFEPVQMATRIRMTTATACGRAGRGPKHAGFAAKILVHTARKGGRSTDERAARCERIHRSSRPTSKASC